MRFSPLLIVAAATCGTLATPAALSKRGILIGDGTLSSSFKGIFSGSQQFTRAAPKSHIEGLPTQLNGVHLPKFTPQQAAEYRALPNDAHRHVYAFKAWGAEAQRAERNNKLLGGRPNTEYTRAMQDSNYLALAHMEKAERLGFIPPHMRQA